MDVDLSVSDEAMSFYRQCVYFSSAWNSGNSFFVSDAESLERANAAANRILDADGTAQLAPSHIVFWVWRDSQFASVAKDSDGTVSHYVSMVGYLRECELSEWLTDFAEGDVSQPAGELRKIAELCTESWESLAAGGLDNLGDTTNPVEDALNTLRAGVTPSDGPFAGEVFKLKQIEEIPNFQLVPLLKWGRGKNYGHDGLMLG